MDEARRVLDRLDRIDGLRRAEAPAPVLLEELRHLLAEGECWLATERAGRSAAAALDRCRESLEGGAE